MWVEYNSWIYDTMPGYECYKIKATAETRQKPYLENKPFTGDGDEVASIASFATAAQLVDIGDARKGT
jgi:hypothetical protein